VPKVSIILPVYNAVATLETAINSVQAQTSVDWELLIIDGASTDGTLAMLEALTGNPAIHWWSEPDHGIYDAMNKGIARAQGDWMYFLGSDDQLMPNVFSLVQAHLEPANKIVFGDVQFDNGYRMHSYLGPRTWLQNTLHHQSAFYHRSVFDTFRYDISLRLVADYELNLLAYKCKWPTLYTGQLIAICNSGGASSDWSESLIETNEVRRRYMNSGWKRGALSTLLILYYGQKQLRRKMYGHKI